MHKFERNRQGETAMECHIDKWEESYKRHENFCLYPHEQYVKFLNRFVRKKNGINSCRDLFKCPDNETRPLRGLDYGCGIGRLTLLLKEFGVDAYGIDISTYAISQAKKLARHLNFTDMEDKYSATNGTKIPFEDNFFDIVTSEAVLDSMKFQVARHVIMEIDRVTKKYFFFSLISGDNSEHFREYADEEIVQTDFEGGTVQSYFNMGKINKLIEGTSFSVKWCHLITEESLTERWKNGRYFILLEKKI